MFLFCNNLLSNNYSTKIEFISLIARGFELLSFTRGFEWISCGFECCARGFEYDPYLKVPSRVRWR